MISVPHDLYWMTDFKERYNSLFHATIDIMSLMLLIIFLIVKLPWPCSCFQLFSIAPF